MTPIHRLLTGLIDYAGLFPPAGLTMTSAVSNYATYRAGDDSWALARFILIASRLEEFENEMRGEDGLPPAPTPATEEIKAIMKKTGILSRVGGE